MLQNSPHKNLVNCIYFNTNASFSETKRGVFEPKAGINATILSTCYKKIFLLEVLLCYNKKMKKKIVAIWAEDKNGLIGVDGHLPWHLPAELAHFKETTLFSAILMGRKTFEGMNRRLLPNRESLVLTRNQELEFEGATFLHSREEVLAWYKNQKKDLYIIGGADIFSSFKEDCDELCRTVIEGEFEGDTYFPKDFSFEDFKEIERKTVSSNEKNPYSFRIERYQRKLIDV